MRAAEDLSWKLASGLRAPDPRVTEGTIMGGRCLRVEEAFLALVDTKSSGLAVKLPRERVAGLIDAVVGRSFAPAGKAFREWLAVAKSDRTLWRSLLEEGIEFVGS